MTNNDKDEKFREGFLGSKDNEFHRQLSGLRNSDKIQNHPDAELMMLEQKRRMREEQIAQTLSGVFARQELEESRTSQPLEYESHRSSTFDQAPAAAPVHRPHAATQIVQLSSGIYDDVASSVFSFQHAMEMMRREAKRARRFNRPYTVCIAAFHELKVINDKLGTAAYEKALDYIAGVLVQAFDLDIEIVGRYSSDRFVIVLPEVEGPSTIHLMEN
ncbi:MAG: diguanylate cyclase, partial [Cyanobacteria bacterium]|nr:diguanylate cyclase [Cyanobacteriota bacterium]